MINEIDIGIFQIAINIDGEWWVDEMIPKWFKELKLNYNSAYNSRKLYARALDIFLHYYLYFPQKENQSLHEYLLDFREKLRTGFTIYSMRTISTTRFSFTTNYEVFSIKPYTIGTINSYITALQYYFLFLKEQNIKIESMFTDHIDWNQLKTKSINSAGGGYGLMMSPLLAQMLGPRKKIIRNIKDSRKAKGLANYFPPELFLDLLKISNPRERAIYLLCGCAGARIGQALSLTRDDYNYDSQEVFIIDPLSDEMGPSGTISRSILLKSQYNINMEELPYKYLASKYPIPSQYAELLWINHYFKLEFFHELSATSKGNPIRNGHPFIFNTSTGRILQPDQVYRSFRIKIKQLLNSIKEEWKEKTNHASFDEKIKLDTEYEYLSSQLKNVKGMHSLRHMYAIMWADLAATSDELNMDDLQSLCAYGLGQTSISSVTLYFTLRKKTREKIINKVSRITEDQMTYIQRNLSEIKKYRKGQKNGR